MNELGIYLGGVHEDDKKVYWSLGDARMMYFPLQNKMCWMRTELITTWYSHKCSDHVNNIKLFISRYNIDNNNIQCNSL